MQINRYLKASGVAATALSVAMLAGCSSDSGSTDEVSSPTTSAMESASDQASMIGPIMVMPGTTTVDATVGRFLNFQVEGAPGDWEIESSDPEVVAVTKGGEQGSATYNPGGEALKAGTAEITLIDKADSVWKVTVTVS